MALLDQYGRPQALGQGGGYKKVSGDGKGKSSYRDYDPVTGILREIHFNGDGTFTTRRWQNVESIAKVASMCLNEYQPKQNKKMERVCIIPAIAHEEIMKRCGWKPGQGGEFDRKKFDQIINDSNSPVLKTRPGRISSQYQKWY